MDLSQFKDFKDLKEKLGMTTLEANLFLLDEWKKRKEEGNVR
jgi:hypothetical protein